MAKFHYHQLGCNQSKLEPHCGISTAGSEISSKWYSHGWISLPPALLQSIKIWAAPWNQYRRIWNLRQVIQPWLSFINASSAATNQNLSRTLELISEELKSAASDTTTAEFLYHYLCCKQSKSELHCGISTGEQKWSPAATQLLFTNNKSLWKWLYNHAEEINGRDFCSIYYNNLQASTISNAFTSKTRKNIVYLIWWFL